MELKPRTLRPVVTHFTDGGASQAPLNCELTFQLYGSVGVVNTVELLLEEFLQSVMFSFVTVFETGSMYRRQEAAGLTGGSLQLTGLLVSDTSCTFCYVPNAGSWAAVTACGLESAYFCSRSSQEQMISCAVSTWEVEAPVAQSVERAALALRAEVPRRV